MYVIPFNLHFFSCASNVKSTLHNNGVLSGSLCASFTCKNKIKRFLCHSRTQGKFEIIIMLLLSKFAYFHTFIDGTES